MSLKAPWRQLDLETCLTGNARKLEVYGRDPAFFRSLDVVRSRWAPGGSLGERLWNLGSILIRPDAIAAGRGLPFCQALHEHRLVPLAFRTVWLDAEQTDNLWRYQANVATPARQSLLRRLMTIGPSIYVVVTDRNLRFSAPATVHITYLKGASVARKRRRAHLRQIAGPPVANTITYLHAADDPADLIREMGLFFSPAAQADLLEAIDAQQDRTAELARLIADLGRRGPAGLLDGSSTPAADVCSQVLQATWTRLMADALACRSFISGETYDTRAALVPDDKRLSLPLDPTLIFRDFGAPY